MDDAALEQRILEAERELQDQFRRREAAIEDYRYDKDQCLYWDTRCGRLYKAEAVDNSIPTDAWRTREAAVRGGGVRLVRIKPSVDIARIENGLMVDGATWWPGKPQFIENELVTERGVLPLAGALTLNSYTAPTPPSKLPTRTPDRWINHVKELFPDQLEHEHFFDYAAHMVQRPEEKVNHGIVISGAQGIGKDTMLLPLRLGVGEWNASEIAPDAVEERFNDYLQSVMLIINEVRPHNEEHRARSFYNRLKPLLAAPPDLLPMDRKNARIVYVRNVLRVFLTTNDHLTMHIPREDRRLFVMHSTLGFGWERSGYFDGMYDWFRSGGMAAAIHWLRCRDISHFNPNKTPPVTRGKEQIMSAAEHVRRDIVSDAFDDLVEVLGERPRVFFPADLLAQSFEENDRLRTALKGKGLFHKIDELGYSVVRNPTGPKWEWRSKEARFRATHAFVRKDVSPLESIDLIDAEGRKRAAAQLAARSVA